jgi:hypothetical protein
LIKAAHASKRIPRLEFPRWETAYRFFTVAATLGSGIGATLLATHIPFPKPQRVTIPPYPVVGKAASSDEPERLPRRNRQAKTGLSREQPPRLSPEELRKNLPVRWDEQRKCWQ